MMQPMSSTDASISIIVVREDELATSEITAGGDEIATGFSSPSQLSS
ncbi:hypothetical protein TIFTF001_020342 [Ficus carica]|uniref:Uncharacterized protein n=1 Tax=Ficus carica TaxID=3494 RepID=A0AA88AXU4_FICCA|nr:hypothetical protein TIFTF001_020342 [Ficus carica]